MMRLNPYLIRAVPRRLSRAYKAKLRGYLASRPVIQLKDLAVEAGLGSDYHADKPYLALYHAEILMKLGYRPVVVPALSGSLGVLLLVREPWISDIYLDKGFWRFLDDGDPLMLLLACRAMRKDALARLERYRRKD